MARQCPPGTTAYTIKSGDTLYKIARTYKISVDNLVEANPGVDPNRLQVGQTICIPVVAPPSACPPGSASYIIQAGDTYSALARHFNTSVEAIAKANPGVNPNALQVGQNLCIPGAVPEIPEKPAPEPSFTCPPGSFVATIQAGDTLSALAQKYHTTVEAILELNPGLDPNSLQVARRVCIPGGQPSTCSSDSFAYILKSGDTIYALSQRYNVTVAAIQRLNPGINPDRLQIGQTLCIPRTNPELEAEESSEPFAESEPEALQPESAGAAEVPPVCPAGSLLYTIKSGDTLHVLAQRHNTTMDAIARLNPSINPSNLQIGQRICLPGGQPSVCPPATNTYIIQAGDTIFGLAQRFNTSVESILRVNSNLNPNNLPVGQPLCIPDARLICVNRIYRVVFLYPADWKQVSPERYEGTDGFFQLSAISGHGLSLEQVSRNEANQTPRPYGNNPSIRRSAVHGQEACFIHPSSDQSAAMNHRAALIVRYRRPVQIGSQSYTFFLLWSDRARLGELAATLEFLP